MAGMTQDEYNEWLLMLLEDSSEEELVDIFFLPGGQFYEND